MSLRLIPNLNVMRPADGNETAVAWKMALESTETPSVIITTRQAVQPCSPTLTEGAHPAERGGYALLDPADVKLTLVASGSEVGLAMQAAQQLASEGIPTRVVSLFSWHLFESQDQAYQATVLPRTHPTLSIEAGTTLGWARYSDAHIGIDRFGASAPGNVLFEKFGFTVDAVVARAKSLLR